MPEVRSRVTSDTGRRAAPMPARAASRIMMSDDRRRTGSTATGSRPDFAPISHIGAHVAADVGADLVAHVVVLVEVRSPAPRTTTGTVELAPGRGRLGLATTTSRSRRKTLPTRLASGSGLTRITRS